MTLLHAIRTAIFQVRPHGTGIGQMGAHRTLTGRYLKGAGEKHDTLAHTRAEILRRRTSLWPFWFLLFMLLQLIFLDQLSPFMFLSPLPNPQPISQSFSPSSFSQKLDSFVLIPWW